MTPTYEFECLKCDKTREKFYPTIMKAPRSIKCKCGQAMKRLPGAGAGIIFRGSGFYETDVKQKKGGEEDG